MFKPALIYTLLKQVDYSLPISMRYGWLALRPRQLSCDSLEISSS